MTRTSSRFTTIWFDSTCLFFLSYGHFCLNLVRVRCIMKASGEFGCLVELCLNMFRFTIPTSALLTILYPLSFHFILLYFTLLYFALLHHSFFYVTLQHYISSLVLISFIPQTKLMGLSCHFTIYEKSFPPTKSNSNNWKLKHCNWTAPLNQPTNSNRNNNNNLFHSLHNILWFGAFNSIQ